MLPIYIMTQSLLSPPFGYTIRLVSSAESNVVSALLLVKGVWRIKQEPRPTSLVVIHNMHDKKFIVLIKIIGFLTQIKIAEI